MGSISNLQDKAENFPLTYIVLKKIKSYLNVHCSENLIKRIVSELKVESIIILLEKPYLSYEFLQCLFNEDNDDNLWYQTTLFMEPIHHKFIKFYILHFLG